MREGTPAIILSKAVTSTSKLLSFEGTLVHSIISHPQYLARVHCFDVADAWQHLSLPPSDFLRLPGFIEIGHKKIILTSLESHETSSKLMSQALCRHRLGISIRDMVCQLYRRHQPAAAQKGASTIML